MEEDTGDLIRITHFINPYNFWYLTEKDAVKAGNKDSIQNRANNYGNEHYRRSIFSTGYQPSTQPDDMVLVYHFQQRQWIRCIVDEMRKDINGGVMCFLWAIDVGIPLKTMANYMRPLPTELAIEPPIVKRGALVDVIPSEWYIEYTELKTVRVASARWSEGVSNNMQTLLEDAATVHIKLTNRIMLDETEVNFGHLSLKALDGQVQNVIDMLLQLGADLMRWPSQDFLEQFVNNCDHTCKRYLKSDGEEINTSNNVETLPGGLIQPVMQRSYDRYCYDRPSAMPHATKQVCNKIWEWQRRNALAINGGLADKMSVVSDQSTPSIDTPTQPPLTIVKKVQPKIHPKLSRIIAAQQQLKTTTATTTTPTNRESESTVASDNVTNDTVDTNSSDAAKIESVLAKLNIKRNDKCQPKNSETRYVEQRKYIMVPAGMDMGNIHFENGVGCIENRRFFQKSKKTRKNRR